MITSTKPRAAVDNDNRARALITVWMSLDTEAQDEALARLIAATIHDGPGTSLEHFAATGRLHTDTAFEELNDVRVPLDREPWVDYLARFMLTKGGRG